MPQFKSEKKSENIDRNIKFMVKCQKNFVVKV